MMKKIIMCKITFTILFASCAYRSEAFQHYYRGIIRPKTTVRTKGIKPLYQEQQPQQDNNAENNEDDLSFLSSLSSYKKGYENIDFSAESLKKKRKQLGGKGSLYSEEELFELLYTHKKFSDQLTEGVEDTVTENYKDVESSNSPASVFPLHDMVLSMMEENDKKEKKEVEAPSEVPLDLLEKSKSITTIASDIDGTLLSSKQTLHPITRDAIKRAVELSSTMNNESPLKYFFPATGKSRAGAYSSLGSEITTLFDQANVCGVFLQGLQCVDGQGNVLYEKKLSHDAVVACENLALDQGISLVAYDGDSLWTTEQTDIVIHLHTHYGEPLPGLIEKGDNKSDEFQPVKLQDYEPGFHKILLMDDDTEKLSKVIRPKLEREAEKSGATVTQAIPTMLEFLPANCSKAVGVKKLCESLNIEMENEVLALGDAENDAEMLSMAKIGVAMGNGCEKAKRSADYVMEKTNDEGAAGMAMRMFLPDF